MSAASDSRDNKYSAGVMQSVPLDKEIQTIYMGTLVCHDDTGYAVSGANTASYVLAGVAAEKVEINVADAADGTHEIRVFRSGIHRFITAGAAATDVGKTVWLTDDQTVQSTPTNVLVGTIVRVPSSTMVDVDIEPGIKLGSRRKIITVPLREIIVQAGTYKIGVYVAHRACKVVAGKFANVVAAVTDGTMAIDNYGSGQTTPAARNLLSTATVSISGITALTPIDLTLSSTAANLLMAEDDYINVTIVAGAEVTTASEGLVLTLDIEEYDLTNA